MTPRKPTRAETVRLLALTCVGFVVGYAVPMIAFGLWPL